MWRGVVGWGWVLLRSGGRMVERGDIQYGNDFHLKCVRKEVYNCARTDGQ